MKLYGLEIKTRKGVYEPREDSFLLSDNALDYTEQGFRVLEVGTGTGLLSLIVADKAKEVVGVDLNPQAVELSKRNADLNEIKNVEFKKSDLFENVNGIFDLIIFNPPYLPSSEDGSRLPGREQWSGGEDGREIIRRFSSEARGYLKDTGKILVVVSSLTGLDEVKELFKDRGYTVETVNEKKLSWETLYLLEIEK